MNLHDITKAIINGNFSNEELNDIALAIRNARDLATRKLKFTLTVGSKITINSTAKPRYLVGATGVIRKINQTKVVIDFDQPHGRFHKNVNCPVSLIEA